MNVKSQNVIEYQICDYVQNNNNNNNNKRIWFEHVKKMNEERLPRKVMDVKSTRRKERGRPRKTQMEGIDMAMDKWRLNQNVYLDRIQWKKALELGRRRQLP